MRSCLLSSMHCSLVMVSSTRGGRPSAWEAAGGGTAQRGVTSRQQRSDHHSGHERRVFRLHWMDERGSALAVARPRRSPDMALLGVLSWTASAAPPDWKLSHLMTRSSSCSCFSHTGEVSRSLPHLTVLESISTHEE
ncbi:hypothetical protein EYF80_032610 [Liparis tanakae]|uniref:Uncharacterized protein n=1 Tax=Liparis tanakae TaxID=230148 RepID=A0A4Z2GVB6_9TELE|nr:hypothetical protein EYF80_032610 [Liparis tanakae]